ncbi:MAG: hypothetical protein K8S27_12230 [Candidatus Omnitrophica bacterium]|nr:hypothetical protein [Candidatus Omnitrophota bacterium]
MKKLLYIIAITMILLSINISKSYAACIAFPSACSWNGVRTSNSVTTAAGVVCNSGNSICSWTVTTSITCAGGQVTDVSMASVLTQTATVCPFFYSWNGNVYERDSHFLVNIDSMNKKTTTYNPITKLQIFDHPRALIKEIEPERSYIDSIKIKITTVNNETIYLMPVHASRDFDKILNIDNEAMILDQGDAVLVEFQELNQMYHGLVNEIQIEANGYYEWLSGEPKVKTTIESSEQYHKSENTSNLYCS